MSILLRPTSVTCQRNLAFERDMWPGKGWGHGSAVREKFIE